MRSYSITALTALLVALDLLVPCNDARAELVLSQLVVELSPTDRSRSDIELWNNGDERSYVSVEPREVIAAGTTSEARKAEPDPEKLGLLVSPVRLVLEPQERRLIRIAAITASTDRERVYRVTVKPVLGPLASEHSGLKVLVGYAVLVLVRPPELRPHITGSRSGNELRLHNDGNVSVELINGQRCEPRTGVCHALSTNRLYSGATLDIIAAPDERISYKEKIGQALLPLEF